MKMRLYYAPGACSLAPHILALEAGLDVDLVKVDLATKRTENGDDYLAVNPKGAVPALVTRTGETLTEAAVVLQYLADLAPEQQLLPPAGSFARYRALEWLNFIATELHKGFGPLWKDTTPAEYRETVKGVLAQRFGYLDRQIGDSAYLLGERFSAPDAYAFTILSWARLFGIDLARWPNVAAYVARVAARPKVRQALVDEGLVKSAAAAA
jgi:glutathione S-transferase